jgi:fatty acid-binding protein DegV
MLTIRPNGRLGLGGILWTGRNLPGRFARTVARRLDPARCYRVIISHCDCADDARQVEDALRASGRSLERVWLVETGAAIGAHAGPGSLVIGIQDYEAPAP